MNKALDLWLDDTVVRLMKWNKKPVVEILLQAKDMKRVSDYIGFALPTADTSADYLYPHYRVGFLINSFPVSQKRPCPKCGRKMVFSGSLFDGPHAPAFVYQCKEGHRPMILYEETAEGGGK
jgi:hypothetical protein